VARLRERAVDPPSSIHVGDFYTDLAYPYGDGPWTLAASSDKAFAPDDHPSCEVCLDELHSGPPYRSGGPLNLWKVTTDEQELKGDVDMIYGRRRYTGAFLPLHNPSASLDWSSVNDAMSDNWGNVDGLGATGWNKFRPTRPSAGLAQFIGEIREVPRMLMTTARGFRDLWRAHGGSYYGGFRPKAVADHWLNTQFGWFPFINDLRSFYKLTKNLDEKISQLRKDNGKWIKRGGIISVDESEEVLEDFTTPHIFPGLNTYFYNGAPYGHTLVKRKYSRKAWFKARFRYWMPDLESDGWRGYTRALGHLYGAYPSPSLVWELFPWSWLADWCSNAGDVIANMTSIAYDNLAAKYAYCMGTTKQEVTADVTANFITGSQQMVWTASLEAKTRYEASPFGFGLTGVDFSARQWSILAALGISKMSKW
jgi:hypothetical protein